MGERVTAPINAKEQGPEANQAGARPSTLAPAKPRTMAWLWWPAGPGHPRSHLFCVGQELSGHVPASSWGCLPGSKFLSILKEGDDVGRPTQSWLSTGQRPCPPFCLDPGQSHQPGGIAARAHTLHAKEPAMAGRTTD